MNAESKRVSKQGKRKSSPENRINASSHDSLSCRTTTAREIHNTKREKGSAQKDIVAQFFDSMLESIGRWIDDDEIDDDESDDESKSESGDASIAHSETTSSMSAGSKHSLTAELQHEISLPPSSVKGMIHFINNNVYEGDLNNNCMHGNGCFRWADGTIYRGQFKDNRISGTGIIEFKDTTWYEGEFLNNVRHGKGLYVDSVKQYSYFGHWRAGAKHGRGVMYYTNTLQNSYDGEWCDNVRHGTGMRRYCPRSGYDGGWNRNIREGNGFMIWPNCDMYDGEWSDGRMCGNGKYIWSSFYNDSMSLPALCVYRGSWEGGLRNGQGVVDFGFGMGSCYRGQFKNNRKDGVGQLVTNNGLILQDVMFVDDNISTFNADDTKIDVNMCGELDLEYHVRETLQTGIELRDNEIVNDYLEANYKTNEKTDDTLNHVTDFNDVVEFEVSSLRKSLRYYQAQLKRIYNFYATVCNEDEIEFEPVLIRLYLWQMYYDCKMHHKGLNLYEIDELLSRNTNWQVKQPHDPFEEIYFWQFLHSLISVARHIYCQKYITNRKPDTVITSAFRQFIEDDILPRIGQKRGKLANGYGRVIPLKNLYKIYLGLDNPCTVRSIMSKLHHDIRTGTEISCNGKVLRGKNTYFYDDEVSYIFDNIQPYVVDLGVVKEGLDLSIFNNVSPKAIIEIFTKILPQVKDAKKVLILETKLTFFEFFEAFVALAEESIKLEEIANFNLI